jgi:hypothetical protein
VLQDSQQLAGGSGVPRQPGVGMTGQVLLDGQWLGGPGKTQKCQYVNEEKFNKRQAGRLLPSWPLILSPGIFKRNFFNISADLIIRLLFTGIP